MLRGAGTVFIALPWLETLADGPKGRLELAEGGDGQAGGSERFIAVGNPGGTAGSDRYMPKRSRVSRTMRCREIPHRSNPSYNKVIVFDGIDTQRGRSPTPIRHGRLADRHQAIIRKPCSLPVLPGPGHRQPDLQRTKRFDSLQIAIRYRQYARQRGC